MQSIFFSEAKQFTLLGKFLILGKLYFFGHNLTDCVFPICKSSIFTVFDVSIFDTGICHNKSNKFDIFFLVKS